MTSNRRYFLPSNINRATFSHTAIDNIDTNEETRSGKGTTHVLGSTIYQEQGTGIAISLQGTFPETEHPCRIKPLEILRQEQASLKWYLTIHVHSTMTSIFKEFCGISEIEENVHIMLKSSMILKDKGNINIMVNVILERFENPFAVKIRETEEQEQKDPSINIATGVVASDEATKDLLGERKTGETSSYEQPY